MPEYQQPAGLVVELLGRVLTDLGFLSTAVACWLVFGHIVQDVTTWHVIGDGPAAMSLASFRRLGLALYNWLGDRDRRDGFAIEEMLLVGVFRQSFAARSVQLSLQSEVLFLQAGKLTFQLLGCVAGFIDLPLEIADSRLGRVELFLHRGGMIGDGVYLLRHQRIIVVNGPIF